MFATTFYETRILNTFRGITAPGINELFVALFFNSPGETGMLGVEVNYTGYTRQALRFDVPTDENNGRGIRNVEDITFPMATADVGVAHFMGVYDAVVGGNMLLYAPLGIPLRIDARNRPNLMAGDILFWISGIEKSNAFKDRVLNNLRGTDMVGFIPRYGLFNGNPELGGVELSGHGYSRPEVIFSAPAKHESEYSRIYNTEIVRFPTPGAVWGNWTHDAILGAATGDTVPEKGGQIEPLIIFPHPIPEFVHANHVARAEPQDIIVGIT